MSEIKISIVVPVYNAEKYLHNCIKSLLGQTYRNIEVILVDDGSIDNSLMICKQYEGVSDIPVRVIQQENRGSSLARKTGVLSAVGEYIGFVDADDYVENNMYKHMISKAEECGADIAVCGIPYLRDGKITQLYSKIESGVYCSDRLEQLKETACMDGRRSPDKVIAPSLCNKIIKKEFMIKHMEDIKDYLCMGDDWVISYPCLWDAQTIVLIDECYYIYRYNTDGITKSYNYHMWKDIKELFRVSMQINQKYGYQKDSYYRLYFQYMLLLCILNETYSQENNSFFSIRTKLMQELKGEVFDYSFKGTLTKFLSTQSNIIFMLMKYRAINALALLIKVIIRRKKRINKSHGKKFTN